MYLTAILPIFIIIFGGFLFTKSSIYAPQLTTSLVNLLFYVVMPITLFIDIANIPVTKVLNIHFLLSYFFASTIIISLVLMLSGFVFKRRGSEIVINAMAATQTNTAYLAIPIFLLLFNTVNPVVGIILVQAIFNFLIILSLEYFSSKHKSNKPWKLACSVFWKAPILIGILLGLVVSICHINLPIFFQAVCKTVAQSAPFLALFMLGLSLTGKRNKLTLDESRETFLLISLKNIFHPLLAFLLGRYIFSLQGFWLLSLVLIAAMPTAKNCYVFANHYQTSESRANRIVIMTMLISIFTISAILSFK